MSVLMQGPARPKVYDTRPTRKLRPCPMMELELESASPCIAGGLPMEQSQKYMSTTYGGC